MGTISSLWKPVVPLLMPAEPLVDSDSGRGKTDLLVEHIDPWSDGYENMPERATDVDLNGVDLVNPFVSGRC